jgi:hypothetical protein
MLTSSIRIPTCSAAPVIEEIALVTPLSLRSPSRELPIDSSMSVAVSFAACAQR